MGKEHFSPGCLLSTPARGHVAAGCRCDCPASLRRRGTDLAAGSWLPPSSPRWQRAGEQRRARALVACSRPCALRACVVGTAAADHPRPPPMTSCPLSPSARHLAGPALSSRPARGGDEAPAPILASPPLAPAQAAVAARSRLPAGSSNTSGPQRSCRRRQDASQHVLACSLPPCSASVSGPAHRTVFRCLLSLPAARRATHRAPPAGPPHMIGLQHSGRAGRSSSVKLQTRRNGERCWSPRTPARWCRESARRIPVPRRARCAQTRGSKVSPEPGGRRSGDKKRAGKQGQPASRGHRHELPRRRRHRPTSVRHTECRQPPTEDRWPLAAWLLDVAALEERCRGQAVPRPRGHSAQR